MRIAKRRSGWWITDTPDGVDDCGPYDMKKDAAEDMKGMSLFIKNEDNREFFTSVKAKKAGQ